MDVPDVEDEMTPEEEYEFYLDPANREPQGPPRRRGMDVPDVEDVRQHERPINRLTRLCEAAIEAMEAHPEYDEDDVRVILMIEDDEDGGLALYGYDDNREAIRSILMHMKALGEVAGFRIEVAEIGRE